MSNVLIAANKDSLVYVSKNHGCRPDLLSFALPCGKILLSFIIHDLFCILIIFYRIECDFESVKFQIVKQRGFASV